MDFLKEIVKEILKSGKDPLYFTNNYCRISHPMKGLVPFKTYPYQSDLLNDYNDLMVSCSDGTFTSISNNGY